MVFFTKWWGCNNEFFLPHQMGYTNGGIQSLNDRVIIMGPYNGCNNGILKSLYCGAVIIGSYKH